MTNLQESEIHIFGTPIRDTIDQKVILQLSPVLQRNILDRIHAHVTLYGRTLPAFGSNLFIGDHREVYFSIIKIYELFIDSFAPFNGRMTPPSIWRLRAIIHNHLLSHDVAQLLANRYPQGVSLEFGNNEVIYSHMANIMPVMLDFARRYPAIIFPSVLIEAVLGGSISIELFNLTSVEELREILLERASCCETESAYERVLSEIPGYFGN